MASLSPILIGSSNRLETTFNLKSGTSLTDTIFDDKNSVTKVLQNTGHGPVLSYAKNTSIQQDSISSKFAKENKSIYKKISAKTDNGSGFFDFGPSQPYVSVNPNSRDKRIKKYDSRVLPVGSVIQDTIRISKFTVSGAGILFNVKQFILQGQNAFNETRIYNPLSVLQSTIRPTSLGLIPRPNRHITVGSGLLDTFLGTLGIKDNTGTPPKGTSSEKNDKTIVNLNQSKGLIRAQTGASARQSVLLKYGGTSSSEKGSFLGNMAKKLFPMFATLPDQFKGVVGNNKYRADQDLYTQFIEYYKKEATDKKNIYNNFIQSYVGNDTPSTETRTPGKVSVLGKSYSNIIELTRKAPPEPGVDGTQIIKKYYELWKGTYVTTEKSPLNSKFKLISGHQSTGDVDVYRKAGELETAEIFKFSTNGIQKQTNSLNALNYAELYARAIDKDKKWSEVVRRGDSAQQVLFSKDFEKWGVLGKGFAGEKGTDSINMRGVLGVNEVDESVMAQQDQIAFWFRDVVNNKYLQFRATVTGINDSSAIEWNEVTYIGMPDKVYNYKGFTRTLGFNFVVYLNSIKELHPTWKKLNYLMSFRSPSEYVDGKYAVPPIVELRIGDMYHNVPIIINSIAFSIPDDVSWETLPTHDGTYSYLAGLIRIPNVKYGQFPNRVEINIGAYVLESENYPRAGNTSFGPDQKSDKSSRFHLRSFDAADNIVGGVLIQ